MLYAQLSKNIVVHCADETNLIPPFSAVQPNVHIRTETMRVNNIELPHVNILKHIQPHGIAWKHVVRTVMPILYIRHLTFMPVPLHDIDEVKDHIHRPRLNQRRHNIQNFHILNRTFEYGKTIAELLVRNTLKNIINIKLITISPAGLNRNLLFFKNIG